MLNDKLQHTLSGSILIIETILKSGLLIQSSITDLTNSLTTYFQNKASKIECKENHIQAVSKPGVGTIAWKCVFHFHPELMKKNKQFGFTDEDSKRVALSKAISYRDSISKEWVSKYSS